MAAANIDEANYLVQPPLVGALSVAVAKARGVHGYQDEIVVAADTLVVIDDDVLGKPEDARQAVHMLQQLRAKSHFVMSGVALRAAGGREWGGVVATEVVMRDYTDTEVDEYVARQEPFDKAGGYAVQDSRFQPVDRVEGCYLNVVGLPLCVVAAGLNAIGAEVKPAGVAPCEYCRAGAPLVSVS